MKGNIRTGTQLNVKGAHGGEEDRRPRRCSGEYRTGWVWRWRTGNQAMRGFLMRGQKEGAEVKLMSEPDKSDMTMIMFMIRTMTMIMISIWMLLTCFHLTWL